MKITIKDIANKANVSVTTVSLVLNNEPGRVSEKTRHRILKIAKEMKYVPNLSAKQLVTQKSNAIGIVVPDLENYFFASLVSGLQDELRNTNYFLLIATSGDEVDEDIKGIDLLVSRGIDLLLIAPSNSSNNHADLYTSKLNDLPIPSIMIDRIVTEFKGPQIQFDDYNGMVRLTDYVISKHHAQIAFVNGDKSKVRTAGRIQGFLASMLSHGFHDASNNIYQGDYSYESGYQLFDQIYDSRNYTAIIAANDMMAYGLFKRAFERDIPIPDAISICGYDNVVFSEMLNPTLTTVNQNMKLLINETIALINSVLKDPAYNENVVLDTELIIRNSVKTLD